MSYLCPFCGCPALQHANPRLANCRRCHNLFLVPARAEVERKRRTESILQHNLWAMGVVLLLALNLSAFM